MNYIKGQFLLALLTTSIVAVSTSANAETKLDTDQARLGYTYGAQIGMQLKNSGLIDDLDLDAVLAGLKDLSTGAEPKMTVEEMQAAQVNQQQKMQAEYAALASNNKAASDAFIEKNASAANVKVTASGLQYEVLREGKGEAPQADSMVELHYMGKTIDGTVFDSSYDRGAPATFSTAGVIPGFSEGIQLMKEGGKIRLFIPAAMAYGENGPPSIGPNQALIFEVELIDVKTAAELNAATAE
ncbi:MAG: FKBP-type peptidyl-prolyl cis-trans isomerase [Pseudomonadota bacterium]